MSEEIKHVAIVIESKHVDHRHTTVKVIAIQASKVDLIIGAAKESVNDMNEMIPNSKHRLVAAEVVNIETQFAEKVARREEPHHHDHDHSDHEHHHVIDLRRDKNAQAFEVEIDFPKGADRPTVRTRKLDITQNND